MENYIELIDGTRIKAFTKAEQQKTITEDKLVLDTTDEYLHIGRSKGCSREIEERDTLDKKRKELFLRNAHRLIEESAAILADSRMFLTPLPIKSGIAYTGTSGFQNPTLGVYLEWWKYNECGWVKDECGVRRPIYYIAGSPLSGNNSCAYIGAGGESCRVSVSLFHSVWRSFIEINTRYTETKQRYEAYSIEDVVRILFE